jgi:hypothetical protein
MAAREFLKEPQLFLAVWLVGWLAGEVLALVAWSWIAFGEEIVAVREGVLIIENRVLRAYLRFSLRAAEQGFEANKAPSRRRNAEEGGAAGLFRAPGVLPLDAVLSRPRDGDVS